MASDVHAEDVGPPEDQGRVPDRIGGREQDQPLRRLGGPLTEAFQVLGLDAGRGSPASGSANPPASGGGPHAAAEFEEGERIAAVCPR